MALPIFDQSGSVELAGAHLRRVDPRLRRQDALGELLVAHLEREEQHGRAGFDGNVGRYAERERGVVHDHVGRDEVVVAGHREVVDLVVTLVVDGDDLVPAHVGVGDEGDGAVVALSAVLVAPAAAATSSSSSTGAPTGTRESTWTTWRSPDAGSTPPAAR